MSRRTVWKYAGSLRAGRVTWDMPGAAHYRAARADHTTDLLEVWYEVQPGATPELVTVQVFGTGHPIPETQQEGIDYWWLDTVFDGPFVWHLYQVDDWGNA